VRSLRQKPGHGSPVTTWCISTSAATICFLGERVVLVDWNWACRGHGAVDVAAWLPSLHLEGGPRPDTILDEPAEVRP
jgi:hypothetical protein